MHWYFVFVLYVVTAVIVNTPPTQYYMVGETISASTTFTLSGYQSVYLASNSFNNTKLQVSSCQNLTMEGNSFFNMSLLESLRIENVSRVSMYRTYFVDAVADPPYNSISACYEVPTHISLVYLTSFDRIYINDTQHTTNSNRASRIAAFNYEYPSLLVSGNEFTISNIQSTYSSSQLPTNHFCASPYATNITTGSTDLHRSLVLVASKIVAPSVSIQNVTVNIPSVNGPPSTSANTTWTHDSIIHIRNSSSSSLWTVRGNSCVQENCPIRVGWLITATSLQTTITSYSVDPNLYKRYQYIAKALLDKNLGFYNTYSHDVQMEPDYESEFSGWNECHHTCRRNCSAAVLIDPETSIYTLINEYSHGVCLNHSAFTNIFPAGNAVGHEDLLIVPPYYSREPFVLSSDNRVNGVLRVRPSSNSGSVIIYMNDTQYVSEEYKSVVDAYRFRALPTDVWFTFNHPIIIQPRFNGSASGVLQNITFTNVEFRINVEDSNRALFSSMIYRDAQYYSTQPSILHRLELVNCIVNGLHPSNGIFTAGSNLLKTENGESGHFSLLSEIMDFLFISNTYSAMDQLLSYTTGTIHISSQVVVRNNVASRLDNGLFSHRTLNATYIQITDNSILLSSRGGGGLSGDAVISIRGNGNNRMVFENNAFTQKQPAAADPTTTSRAFSLTNLGNLDASSNTADGYMGIGLYFNNITNYPCQSTSLVNLENANPYLNGSIYDLACGELTGCRKLTCFQDPSLIPAYCVVDKSYSTSGPLYRIQYWHTIQGAIDECRAISPRLIYLTPDVYFESGLVIRSYLGIADFEILSANLGNRSIIVGNSHAMTTAIGSSVNVTIRGLRFANPTGLLSFSSTIDPYILNLDSSDLVNTAVLSCEFVSYQSISTLSGSLPTTLSGWETLIANLTAHGSVKPNIRRPNTNAQVLVHSYGTSRLEDTNFYGSELAAYRETKRVSRTTTYINNIIGENHWGGFLYTSVTSNSTVSRTRCIYVCSGLSNLGIAVAVGMFQFTNGINFQFFSNNYTFDPDVYDNPYVTERLPYGNPFPSTSTYLAALWVTGLTGSEWTDFKIRNSQLRGYPGAVRLQDVAESVLIFNDVSIYINDTRKLPRQIQWENYNADPTGYMYGTLFDVRIGAPEEDAVFLDITRFCNALCLPAPSQLTCEVSFTRVTPTDVEYNSINAAIAGCPYNSIYLVDPTYSEDIVTNFVASTSRTSPTLLIRGYGPVVIIGNHRFLETALISDPKPITVQWQNLEFQNNVTSSQPLIDIVPVTSGSITPIMEFTSVVFSKSDDSIGAPNNTINCVSCHMTTLTLTTSTMTGSWLSGVYMKSTDAVFKSTTTTISGMSNTSVYLETVGGYEIRTSILRCNNPIGQSGTSKGCLHVFGSATLTTHVIENTEVSANNLVPSQVYDGIYWNLNQALSFSQVALLTANIQNSLTAATGFGIRIVVALIDSNYPCAPSTDATVNALQAANTEANGNMGKVAIVDAAGVIVGLQAVGTPQLGCFIYDEATTTPYIQADDATTVAWLVYGAIFLGILWILVAISGRGMELCFGASDWAVQTVYRARQPAQISIEKKDQ